MISDPFSPVHAQNSQTIGRKTMQCRQGRGEKTDLDSKFHTIPGWNADILIKNMKMKHFTGGAGSFLRDGARVALPVVAQKRGSGGMKADGISPQGQGQQGFGLCISDNFSLAVMPHPTKIGGWHKSLRQSPGGCGIMKQQMVQGRGRREHTRPQFPNLETRKE